MEKYSIIISKYIIEKKAFFSLPYVKCLKDLYLSKQDFKENNVDKIFIKIEDDFQYLLKKRNEYFDIKELKKILENINLNIDVAFNLYEEKYGKNIDVLIQKRIFERSTLELKIFLNDIICYKDKIDNFIIEKDYKDFNDFFKKNSKIEDISIIRNELHQSKNIKKNKKG